MKKPIYLVRVRDESVIVEHRASVWPSLGVLAVVYLCYCLLPDVRKTLVDLYTWHVGAAAGSALILFLIPLMTGVGWFRGASGEVLYCDRNELRFARRRVFRPWQRFRFPAGDVRKLRRAVRSAGKTSYSVLTFEVGGRAYDVLADMKYTDDDRVLRACRSMGIDVVIDEVGDAMLKDIEKRGWWINPFRTDDLGRSSDSSRG